MQPKIYWIDNLRGIACLMVVMIHTTTWYVTNAHSVSPITWDIANVLNSASRVSVPLFFMISGYLFFGERSAQSRHFLRIGLCLFFYSAIALLYIALFTSINVELALKNLLQKPVFYHLWFFFAIAVIYLVSPLIQVKNVGGKMLLVLMVVIGIIANPNTVPQKIDGFEWLPINLYINGDTFYYILYGMLGRAIGMMDTQHKALSWVSAALFATGVFIISRGTLYELQWRGNFADTWYLYCGPMVFICAIALLTLVKNTLYTRTICGLGLISRHSLGIYGFHALIIHALRTRGIELKKLANTRYYLDLLRDVGSEFVTFYAGTTNRQKQISELVKARLHWTNRAYVNYSLYSSWVTCVSFGGFIPASRIFFCTATAPNKLKKKASP